MQALASQALRQMDPFFAMLKPTPNACLTEEVVLHLQTISCALFCDPLVAPHDRKSNAKQRSDALSICKRVGSVDGRKLPTSLLQAFAMGKVGKQAIRALALKVESSSKTSVLDGQIPGH